MYYFLCFPSILTKLSQGAARLYAPRPPMAVRLAADLRPSADGSAVHTYLVVGGGYSLGQLRAWGSCALGQTDGRTDRQTDIA